MPQECDDDQPIPTRRRSHRGRHARRSKARRWGSVLVPAFAVLTIGVVSIDAVGRPVEPASADPGLLSVADPARVVDDRASRDLDRPDPSAAPVPSVTPAPSVPAASPSPTRRTPVAGLIQIEMDNAVAIVEEAKRRGLPERAAVVAIVTALQETHLRNLANSKVSQSLKLPHQGVGSNFDSVGLFQQRPSQGWGTPAQLMNPATAAGLFYARLVTVSGWETKTVGAAAQAVQRSAFPDAYDKHRSQAEKIVDAIF
ncbi:hypothetical protein ACNTMW_16395 [Planosporangium sp. 12N6]|uniref:hypothetical protein n=1 Tax=Planosporangium spinosum TaxID=3402278 RepID=UPI003CF75DB2